jgi:hypothetical protein
MSSVFESYEQQFSTITADITARIGKIPNLTGSKKHLLGYLAGLILVFWYPLAEKKTAIGVVEGNLDEAKELVSL